MQHPAIPIAAPGSSAIDDYGVGLERRCQRHKRRFRDSRAIAENAVDELLPGAHAGCEGTDDALG
jgi:hypothetical protein